jgi:alanyl-tRNA synthetase
MGDSIELCGGTHVRSTGQIGTLRFTAQGGVAAGVRRIEAVTGSAALAALHDIEARLARVADALRTQPEHVERRIEQLLEDRQRLEERLQHALREARPVGAAAPTHRIQDVDLTISDTPTEDRGELGQVADAFRAGKQGAALVLFGTAGRGAVHVALTEDLVQRGLKAGDLVNRIAAVSGGRGGGRPHFASAGAGDPERLDAAREATPALVAEWLAAAS